MRPVAASTPYVKQGPRMMIAGPSTRQLSSSGGRGSRSTADTVLLRGEGSAADAEFAIRAENTSTTANSGQSDLIVISSRGTPSIHCAFLHGNMPARRAQPRSQAPASTSFPSSSLGTSAAVPKPELGNQRKRIAQPVER